MALEKYRQKRDFKVSPEPAGEKARRSPSGRTPRFFCVQKHLASHLHYDFRLEHDGVLLSWAVPKGPSLDPSVKRLAMHVEDHPIEYGTFEGVIPAGYGAGIVMLWDRGTWTPEVDDVDAALKKGDLKITLDGYKLKGSWVLVRTKGAAWASKGGADRSWLLIKHKDEWAGPVDITEFAPLSVKSSSDFADILAQDNPEIWVSNRPAQGGETGAMFEKNRGARAGDEGRSEKARCRDKGRCSEKDSCGDETHARRDEEAGARPQADDIIDGSQFGKNVPRTKLHRRRQRPPAGGARHQRPRVSELHDWQAEIRKLRDDWSASRGGKQRGASSTISS